MKISNLAGNPKNPRKITDKKLDQLRAALTEFGDLSGIVFNRRTKQLVGGHQRVKVLPRNAEIKVTKTYSEPTPSGTVAEGHVLVAGERFKYREVDWDDTREKAANIAANQHGGDWDFPQLTEWMKELDASGFDLKLTGFESLEMLGFASKAADAAEKVMDAAEVEVQVLPPGDPDHVPEPPKEPKTKRGDIYRLGAHRLVCGDATDAGAWKSIEGDHASTMVFTSPPYGVGDGARIREHYVPGADVPKSLYKTHEDDPDAWPQLMRDWTGQALAHSAVVICNVQMLANNKRALALWQSEFADFLVDVAIWDKSHGPPQMAANVLTNVFEYLFILSREEGASRSVPLAKFHGNQTNVVRVGGAKNNEFAKIHKATMPLELVEWAIDLGQRAKHIIDPFGGTGTTMIAAEKHGRSAGLIEMDPSYCDVIVNRWETYTGKKAELIDA